MRTSAAAAAATTASRWADGPELVVSEQLSSECTRWHLDVHEVAGAASGALVAVPVLALGLLEVGHGGELGHEHSSGVESALQFLERLRRLLLCRILDVNVPEQVVAQVVADHELLDASVRVQLFENVFVEIVEMLLQELLLVFDGVALWVEHGHCDGIGVHVRDEDGLREGRLVVVARALVAVTTRANLPIEGTIDSVCVYVCVYIYIYIHGFIT